MDKSRTGNVLSHEKKGETALAMFEHWKEALLRRRVIAVAAAFPICRADRAPTVS